MIDRSMMMREVLAAEYGESLIAPLEHYHRLLIEWQARLNLVASSTLDDIWQRHFLDSAQVAHHVEATDGTRWLDIGSGAGFPAIVLALMLPGTFMLVEARTKKCVFLQEVVDELGLAGKVSIRNTRIEDMAGGPFDLITARACAPLDRLLAWGLPFADGARWLLLKGRTAAAEIQVAQQQFSFTYRLIPSLTEPTASIVDLSGVRRRLGADRHR